MKKMIKVAIMPREEMREYTLKVAKGEMKPKKGAPKIFFPSLRALTEALNDNSQILINAIIQHQPESIAELAAIVSQDRGNVSRTLKRLATFGLVSFKEKGRGKKPIAEASGIQLEYSFSQNQAA